MSTAPVKSLIHEQVEEAQAAQVRGTFHFPRDMLVRDLRHPMKADWLKRRPIARPRPCP
ncbi:hypothetical protein N5D52_14875 [Pseudomonas sp. GD03860]|uniref:hypothetical protein n=1 Tax=Pseudomonas sp. GD03860 TaxID=2975389 RepID=UPI00244B4FE4|nr:hypothetical protein [Pseudomonas sp. GD03860]MDH0638229.1 hypothetical protein [Pseudomonas sp. GD03860]